MSKTRSDIGKAIHNFQKGTKQMKGTILHFNRSSGEGLIRGEDGNRYEYSISEFKSEAPPIQGLEVDFEVKDGRAAAIYLLAAKGGNNTGVRIDASAWNWLGNMNGPRDNIGVGLALIAIICLFLPFANGLLIGKGNATLGTASLIETGWGKLLFVIALGISFLCYRGVDRKWVKAAICVFAAVVLIKSWDLISDLSRANSLTDSLLGKGRSGPSFFALLAFGFYATLISTALLVASAFLGRHRHLLLALVAVASIALAGRLALISPEAVSPEGTRPEAVRPEIGGPFTLTGADGKPVSDSAFRGKLMLVFFGYTFCPDVCPTGLSQIAQAMDLLGKDAEQVVPILISIDPERDGPAQIGAYVAHFHPRLIGLTGTPEQIAAVAKSYRAYYAKAPGGTPEAYSVDHSSFTYLMARDGTFRAVFSHGSTPEAIAKGVREHL